MERKKIVIALGGNALGKTPVEQLNIVKDTAKAIASLAKEDVDLIIGHGNGPQIGIINQAFDNANRFDPSIPKMPFAECGAMSQGYIGYHPQQAIENELNKQGINRQVATIITQVVVDHNDKSFSNPSKPIGLFYSKEEAMKIAEEKGYDFKEDAGRGYRRVVPSPLPVKIAELPVISSLVEQGTIVIVSGGGWIPVIENEEGYMGIDAVIDKDQSCAKIAGDLNAELLLILTAVDYVYINFNKPEQKVLNSISTAEVTKYIEEGQFAKGSMLPKIEASLNYLRKVPQGKVIITSLKHAKEALLGEIGTIIQN